MRKRGVEKERREKKRSRWKNAAEEREREREREKEKTERSRRSKSNTQVQISNFEAFFLRRDDDGRVERPNSYIGTNRYIYLTASFSHLSICPLLDPLFKK